MRNKLLHFKVFLFLLISILIFSSCSSSTTFSTFNDKDLIVHYIDVGQGDSILIQINGKNMLIDAGTTESSNKLLSYLKKQKINKLDLVVATHPHEDHIGGN